MRYTEDPRSRSAAMRQARNSQSPHSGLDRIPSPAASEVQIRLASRRSCSPFGLSSCSNSRHGYREDVASNGSTHSRLSPALSPRLATPDFDAVDFGLKRASLSSRRNLFFEKDQVEIYTCPQLEPISGVFSSDESVRDNDGKSTSYGKVAELPFPPQYALSVFPVQFNWPPLANSAMNSALGNGPPSGSSSSDRIAIDPSLSSVRSSAAQHGAVDLPNLHLPDETLASAAVSPGSFDAAMLGAAKLDEGDEGDMLSPGDGTKKDQPFSRSPELRVSHKIAERKRRKEMKDLFDELRELLPAERGTKSSKWEILSKSIDFIAHLKTANGDLAREIDKLHREVDVARGGTEAFQPGAYHPYQIPSTYPPPGPYPPAGTGGSVPTTSSPTTAQQGPAPRS